MGPDIARESHLIRWRQVMPQGGAFHVARTTYRPTTRLRPHRHDFAELFWIERGKASHTVNRHTVTLSPGDVTFIRPDDLHTLRTADREGFVLVNIACPVARLEPVRERYFGDAGGWPWREGDLPMQAALSPAGLDRLAGWTDQLAAMSQSRLEFDAFLLDLLNLLRRSGHAQAALPDWLSAAIAKLTTADDLAAGPARLARLAHRSPEHVNRVIQQHYRQTTTQLINRLRLERAARLLRMTGRPILQVAHDCGIDNLSYFYRLFKAHYGLPPRKYRQEQQALIR